MSINNGWVSLSRDIVNHWVFEDPWRFKAWCYLLLIANHAESKKVIKGEIFTCKRGETLRSLDTLSKELKCDKSKVRRFLNLLQSDNMIELKNESKTTRITICNYDTYQVERNADETQMKRKRNANETQTTPNNNVNNNNNENNVNNLGSTKFKIEERKLKFADTLKPFLNVYGRELLNEFYAYWTEPNKSNTKFKQELQKTWDLSRRLETWAKNDKNFNKNQNGTNNNNHKPTMDERIAKRVAELAAADNQQVRSEERGTEAFSNYETI